MDQQNGRTHIQAQNPKSSVVIPPVSNIFTDIPSDTDTGWIELDTNWLQGTWVLYSTDYPLKYRIAHGRVYLSGLAKSGGSSNVLKLPASIAPYHNYIVPCVSNNAFATARIRGRTWGTPADAGMISINGYSATWVSLHGISWYIGEGEAA